MTNSANCLSFHSTSAYTVYEATKKDILHSQVCHQQPCILPPHAAQNTATAKCKLANNTPNLSAPFNATTHTVQQQPTHPTTTSNRSRRNQQASISLLQESAHCRNPRNSTDSDSLQPAARMIDANTIAGAPHMSDANLRPTTTSLRLSPGLTRTSFASLILQPVRDDPSSSH